MRIPAMNLTFSCCCYLGLLGVLTSHQVLSLMALRRVTHLTNLTLSVIRLSLQRKFAWITSEVKACCTILYRFTQWSSCMYNWQHKHNRFYVYHWHLSNYTVQQPTNMYMYSVLHYTVCCSNAWSPFEVKLKSIDLCSPIYIIVQNRQDILVKCMP